MLCPQCLHETDDDREFCQHCNSFLKNPKPENDPVNRTVIIVIEDVPGGGVSQAMSATPEPSPTDPVTPSMVLALHAMQEITKMLESWENDKPVRS